MEPRNRVVSEGLRSQVARVSTLHFVNKMLIADQFLLAEELRDHLLAHFTMDEVNELSTIATVKVLNGRGNWLPTVLLEHGVDLTQLRIDAVQLPDVLIIMVRDYHCGQKDQ